MADRVDHTARAAIRSSERVDRARRRLPLAATPANPDCGGVSRAPATRSKTGDVNPLKLLARPAVGSSVFPAPPLGVSVPLITRRKGKCAVILASHSIRERRRLNNPCGQFGRRLRGTRVTDSWHIRADQRQRCWSCRRVGSIRQPTTGKGQRRDRCGYRKGDACDSSDDATWHEPRHPTAQPRGWVTREAADDIAPERRDVRHTP